MTQRGNPHSYDSGWTIEQHRDELVERLGKAINRVNEAGEALRFIKSLAEERYAQGQMPINVEIVLRHIIRRASYAAPVSAETEFRERIIEDLKKTKVAVPEGMLTSEFAQSVKEKALDPELKCCRGHCGACDEKHQKWILENEELKRKLAEALEENEAMGRSLKFATESDLEYRAEISRLSQENGKLVEALDKLKE